MNQVAFIFGGILVYWKSVAMALAVLTGLLLFVGAYTRRSNDLSGAALLCPLSIAFSLFLARLLHWYFTPDGYEGLRAALSDFSHSGYALSGAFFGCLLSAGILRILNIVKNLPLTLDCMSIGGCAAIAVGRLGAFFAEENRGEILSDVTNLPWVYPVMNATSGALEYRVATFLFQSVIAAIILIVLVSLYWCNTEKRKHKDGDMALLFLLLYCTSQIVLDSMRYDSLRLRSNGFISVVQVFCALALVLVMVVFSIRLRKISCIAAWFVFAICMGGVSYMEYYVQRHGNQSQMAYAMMSVCLIAIITMGSILWHRLSMQELTEKKTERERSGRNHMADLSVVFSSVLTAVLLLMIVLYGGVPRKTRIPKNHLDVIGKFYMNSSNAISDVTSSIMNIEKKYWISGGAHAAPKPNRDNFGRTEKPADMQAVIERVEKLLDGQTLYFSPNVSLMDGTDVRYYLDETILVITWKQVIDNTVYTFSEVKIADPSQFRRYLAGGEYGSEKLAIPTEMANSVNSVVASSGDYYKFRNAGVIVYDGVVCRVNSGADTCYIDYDGTLHFTGMSEILSMEAAQKYVEEKRIQFSVAFGPILVENGEKHNFGGYGLGEVGDQFARAALCQMGELHYLLVNANAEGRYNTYPTMYRFADRIFETGCQMAYALDGGQTAALVMDGELINHVTKGYQRKISDIIYFATAMPNQKK